MLYQRPETTSGGAQKKQTRRRAGSGCRAAAARGNSGRLHVTRRDRGG